ncbi:cache domain-containing protein [Paenibacillus sp. DMB20]|uniref:cache domain-containing protein n=1 Tax=Paenibacillus sp. DMB20 TaxID=1642570 RepID=UPI000B16F6F2
MKRDENGLFYWKKRLCDLMAIRLRSIQVMITFLFSIVTMLVVLAVSFLLYDKFSRTAEDNAYLNIQQIIDQVKSNLETYVKGMQDIYAVVEEQFDSALEVGDGPLYGQLSTLLQTREDLVSIALFTPKGEPVIHVPELPMMRNTGLTSQSWFETSVREPGKWLISAPHIQNLYAGQYKWVVSMSKTVTYTSQGQKKTGVLLVDINFRTIDELSSRVSLGKKRLCLHHGFGWQYRVSSTAAVDPRRLEVRKLGDRSKL